MTDATWIFPVGHYLGPFFPGRGEALECHRVRIGTEIAKLFTDIEFLVWGLAHGLPGGPRPADSDGIWTRAALTAAGAERGDATGADVADAVAGLLAAGVLVEVGPGGVDPEIFAHGHRLQPLLSGLGVSPARPDTFHIGLFGEQVTAAVDQLMFDMWQWAPRVASLWALHQMQAETAHVLGDSVGGVDGLLRRLHLLLANSCGYLDTATST
jgi:hypothetical protein